MEELKVLLVILDQMLPKSFVEVRCFDQRQVLQQLDVELFFIGGIKLLNNML